MTVEATEENLRHYYIDLNTRIEVMPEVFGMPKGTLRKRLAKFGIKKPQNLAGKNVTETHLKNDPDYFKNLNSDPDKTRRAQAAAVISRRANRIASLEAEGASFEEVYRVFITENNSIIKTGEHFNRNKGQMRSLLSFYNITKSPELVKDCRETGFAELYADSERVAEMVGKTQTTIRERYGSNWYYNHASQEELAVFAILEEAYPDLEIINGTYEIIRRPGTGGAMQLDFYFPEIRFAVEYNGIRFHDKSAYLEDLENGTMNSREALKDYLCKMEGIPLVHVWSDEYKDGPEGILNDLFEMINERVRTFAIPLAV